MNNTQSTSNIHTIFPLSNDTRFDKSEALHLIDTLYSVTTRAKNKINAADGHVQYNKHNATSQTYHQEILNVEIQKWSEKMRRLGAIPLSLFKVKLSALEGGFYTWEFPTSELIFHEE